MHLSRSHLLLGVASTTSGTLDHDAARVSQAFSWLSKVANTRLGKSRLSKVHLKCTQSGDRQLRPQRPMQNTIQLSAAQSSRKLDVAVSEDKNTGSATVAIYFSRAQLAMPQVAQPPACICFVGRLESHESPYLLDILSTVNAFELIAPVLATCGPAQRSHQCSLLPGSPIW